jgi:hypothetical protein
MPKKQKRNIAILDEKWEAENRDDDAETGELMKTFGCRVWYNLELVEDDYWDIARARHYRLDSYDMKSNLIKEVEPLEDH